MDAMTKRRIIAFVAVGIFFIASIWVKIWIRKGGIERLRKKIK